jgi:hypothetical protein
LRIADATMAFGFEALLPLRRGRSSLCVAMMRRPPKKGRPGSRTAPEPSKPRNLGSSSKCRGGLGTAAKPFTSAGQIWVNASVRYRGRLLVESVPRGAVFELRLSDIENVRKPLAWADEIEALRARLAQNTVAELGR